MKWTRELVQKVHHYNTRHNWDTVHIIGGDEGKGKSNLMMHLVDTYLRCLRGEVKEEHIKHIAQDQDTFKQLIKDLKKYEPAANDEAGDITGRRAMSKFNVQMTNTYKVIRGHNNYTTLLTPTVFDMEPYFLKHRCKGLWYVYRRGRVAFWGQKNLRKMISLNQGRYIKSVWAVAPDFIDKFPKYKGPLLEPYEKQKEEGMRRKQQEMLKNMDEDKSPAEIERRVKIQIVSNAKQQGYTNSEIAHILNCSTRTINTYWSEAKEERKVAET